MDTSSTITACPICEKPTDTNQVEDGFYREGAMRIHGALICDSAWCADLLYLQMTEPPKTVWPPLGRTKCFECKGTGNGSSERHYVRHLTIHHECDACDGLGHVRARGAA